MSNNIWEYKNNILKTTNHLRINMPLLSIKKWNIKEIDKRTYELIKKIQELYPYVSANEEKILIHITKNNVKVKAYFYLSDGSVEIISNSYVISPILCPFLLIILASSIVTIFTVLSFPFSIGTVSKTSSFVK